MQEHRTIEGYSLEIEKRISGPRGHVLAVKAQPARTKAGLQPAEAPAPAAVPTS